PIPNRGRLALIRDPDRRQIGSLQPSLLHRLPNPFLGAAPNRRSVVPPPPRLRKNLLMLLLRHANHSPRAIEDHEPCAGCALINRSNIFLHALIPLRSTFEVHPILILRGI